MELKEEVVEMDADGFDLEAFIRNLPDDYFSKLDPDQKFLHSLQAKQPEAFKHLFELSSAYDKRIRNRVFFIEVVVYTQAALGLLALIVGF